VECAVTESFWQDEDGSKTFVYDRHKVGTSLISTISYLELKPSESITIEDEGYIVEMIQDEDDYDQQFAFDYGRSLGYILPFMGMSEDDLTKKGWVKIIE
jgi:hypothetical protein